METTLAPRPSPATYAAAARAKSTWDTYAFAWESWSTYARSRGYQVGPPVMAAHLAHWLTDAASGVLGRSYRPSTLALWCAAMRSAHQLAGHVSPTQHDSVRAVLAGIRRVHRAGDQRKAAPLLVEDLRRALGWLPLEGTLHQLRDRAVALVAWCGGLRASEVCGLTVADVTWDVGGCVLVLKRTKTNQEGRPRLVGIAHGRTPGVCPIVALRAWWTAAAIQEGPAFREVRGHGRLGKAIGRRAVDRLARRLAAAAGKDSTRYSSHSFRAGAATSCHLAGVDAVTIAQHLGHQDLDTTRGYLRDPEVSVRPTAGLL